MATSGQDKKGHSIKVPRLYKVAAGVLKDFRNGVGSVKTLVHSEKVMKKHPNFKAIYSLVISCVDHLPELESAFNRFDILENEKPLDGNLAFILASELIWGKGVLPGESKPVETLKKYGDKLKSQLQQEGSSFEKNSETVLRRPRYVRINVLLASKKEVMQHFIADGFEQVYFDADMNYDSFIEKVKSLEAHQFMEDFHVKNLLIFPERTEFHRHPLYVEGKVILQDKASCLPVCALAPPPGSAVLDACAAPGMKTSQLASTVSSRFIRRGQVIAVERDATRCETLKSMLAKSGADNFVRVIHEDFLKLDPKDYEDVQYILLDPTCSGSGVKDRHAGPTDVSEARLMKLFSLQCKMLRHALSFPNVQRVSYSTCSIEKKENEEVIADVMSNPTVYEKWEVAEALPEWERRGKNSKKYKFAKKLIRSDPEKDLCIGFFVAVLQRKDK